MLFACHTVAGQVKFTASVNPSQIAKDEYAELRLTVENSDDVDQISPPPLRDFTIVSGPSQESSTSVINNVAKTSVSLVYIIRPKSPGTFSIPPAIAIIGGKAYRSQSVSLKVSNTVSGNSSRLPNNIPASPFAMTDPFDQPSTDMRYNDYLLRKGESGIDKVKNNMLVRVEVNKNACYVGEPVIATYKLYTRLKSESVVTQNPSFNGFSVTDLQLPNNMNYTTERYNGKEYSVFVIRKVQLYPLQAGNLELEPVEVENKVRFVKAEYAGRQNAGSIDDFFRDFGQPSLPPEAIEDQKVSLQSKPVSIMVKALPDAGKPADFRGAVGNFNLAGGIEKPEFTTDDAGKLQLILGGEGNMQLVNNPEVQWPEGVDAFEPKVTEDISKVTVPVSGRKLIEYSFTVTKPGTYTIPPVTFSFFDPKTQSYKTVATKAAAFTVTQGTGKAAQDTLNIVNNEKRKGFLQKLFSNRRLVVSIVAAFIIIGLITWLKWDNKRSKKEKEILRQEAQEKALAIEEPVEQIIINQKNPLEDAEQYLVNDDSRNFYVSLNLAFRNFLAHKLSIAAEDLNKKTINDGMDKKGIALETSLQVQQLLDEVEWELYTPFSDTSKMQQVYDKASDLVQLLNTYKV